MDILTKEYRMSEEVTPFFKQIGENILSYTLPIMVAIWKGFDFLNKWTEAKSRREREFVKDVAREVSKEVVREVMDSVLSDLQRNVQQMQKDNHESFRSMNDRVDELYKDFKRR